MLERFPPLSGRLRQDSLTPFGKPQMGLALTGRNTASRRLLPSLRELIAFPSERTSGRHSPKCQRLFQWRIDGCRELTGNWFSPREAVGSQLSRFRGRPPTTSGSSLKFQPSSTQRAPLRPRPRWRRGRDTQPNRQLAREEMRVESCEKGARRAAGALRAKPFFSFSTTTPTSSQWLFALTGRTRR